MSGAGANGTTSPLVRNNMKQNVFISCGIFKAELEYLAVEKALDMDIVFLDAALHVNFDRLKARLVQALEENPECGSQIKIIYGNCHPEMQRIVDRYSARKIKAINCIEAIVGADEIKQIDKEAKSFFLTAGWVNNWENIFAAGTADFNFDFRTLFGDYKRIILFDAKVIPIDEGKVEQFSKFTGLPVERRQISLDRLLKLIKNINTT
jgi:hypothetical protein